jgi:hypothetical protein
VNNEQLNTEEETGAFPSDIDLSSIGASPNEIAVQIDTPSKAENQPNPYDEHDSHLKALDQVVSDLNTAITTLSGTQTILSTSFSWQNKLMVGVGVVLFLGFIGLVVSYWQFFGQTTNQYRQEIEAYHAKDSSVFFLKRSNDSLRERVGRLEHAQFPLTH